MLTVSSSVGSSLNSLAAGPQYPRYSHQNSAKHQRSPSAASGASAESENGILLSGNAVTAEHSQPESPAHHGERPAGQRYSTYRKSTRKSTKDLPQQPANARFSVYGHIFRSHRKISHSTSVPDLQIFSSQPHPAQVPRTFKMPTALHSGTSSPQVPQTPGSESLFDAEYDTSPFKPNKKFSDLPGKILPPSSAYLSPLTSPDVSDVSLDVATPEDSDSSDSSMVSSPSVLPVAPLPAIRTTNPVSPVQPAKKVKKSLISRLFSKKSVAQSQDRTPRRTVSTPDLHTLKRRDSMASLSSSWSRNTGRFKSMFRFTGTSDAIPNFAVPVGLPSPPASPNAGSPRVSSSSNSSAGSTRASLRTPSAPPTPRLTPRPMRAQFQTSTPLLRPSSLAPKSAQVLFSSRVMLYDTWSKAEYDRKADEFATCNNLTPEVADSIKKELNEYKAREMSIHDMSTENTHYF